MLCPQENYEIMKYLNSEELLNKPLEFNSKYHSTKYLAHNPVSMFK